MVTLFIVSDGLTGDLVHFGVGARLHIVGLAQPFVERMRKPLFLRRAAPIPVGEAVGVHRDMEMQPRRIVRMGVEDVALALGAVRQADRRRDVEMHPVGVADRDASGLALDLLARRIADDCFVKEVKHLARGRVGRDRQCGDDVEIVFVVGAPDRNRRVDRHRALRIKPQDVALQRAARALGIGSHGLIALAGLGVQAWRQLNRDGDVGQDRVQRVEEWVAVEPRGLVGQIGHGRARLLGHDPSRCFGVLLLRWERRRSLRNPSRLRNFPIGLICVWRRLIL